MTPWLLGCALVVALFGGIAVDVAHAVAVRAALAAATDAAALAGAGALDVDRYRLDGTVVLDPEAATARARALFARQRDLPAEVEVRVDADQETVRVHATGRVDLTLLRLLRATEPLEVQTGSAARPVVRGGAEPD